MNFIQNQFFFSANDADVQKTDQQKKKNPEEDALRTMTALISKLLLKTIFGVRCFLKKQTSDNVMIKRTKVHGGSEIEHFSVMIWNAKQEKKKKKK